MEPAEPQPNLQGLLHELNIESKDNFVDFEGKSNKEIINFLREAVSSGKYVLHGSNSRDYYKILEPRQAKDNYRPEGSQTAVYATTSTVTALFRSIVDRDKLAEKCGSYTTAWNNGKFYASPNAYPYLKNKDEEVVTGGYVYILPISEFVPEGDGGSDFVSYNNVKPLLICKIPSQMADRVLGSNSFFPYTEEVDNEFKRMAEERKQKDG